MATIASVSTFKKRQKVVAARDFDGVPEGTVGKVKLINGITWKRYWVMWENGQWLGSLDQGDLVAVENWDTFVADRERIAANGGGEQAAAGADEGAAEADAGNTSGVPDYLLERSKKALEKARAKAAA